MLCLAPMVTAQEPVAARLRVTVVDQTGGRIPEATVIVVAPDGPRPVEESRPAGVFLTSLRPGKYSVTAAALGFAPGTIDIDLPATGAEVSIELQVAVTEKVSVRSLRIEGIKGRILTAEDLKQLPNNEIEMRYMLLELAGSRGRPGDVAFYVDGFSDFHRLPPKGAIELIQINAEPYSAEFAEPGTRRIEIITKPGAEGTFGEFKFDLSDESLNATDAFATSKPPLQRRTFSGYYSAPIIRDKWGFYGYAGRWEQDENAIINATVLNLVPEPVPFAATLPAPFRENNLTINSGYAVANQVRLMAEYARNTTHGENQGLRTGGFRLPEQAYTVANMSNVGRLSLLSVVGPRTVHELRVRMTDEHNVSRAISNQQAIMVLDSFTDGGNQESRLIDEQNLLWQIDTKLTQTFGRHTLNTGFQFDGLSRTLVNEADFGGMFVFGADTARDADGIPLNLDSPLAEITPIDNYLNTITGVPGAAPTMFVITQGDPRAALRQWEFAAYAQSDWRRSDNLTVSYGLRYEAQTNLNNRHDFAPRLGLAWSPGGDKGLIRAGAGLFYDRVNINLTLEPLRLDPAKQQRYVISRPSFFMNAGAPPLGTPPEQTLLRKSEGMESGVRTMANASYEREIPWSPFKASLFGAAGYTWERGSRLPRLRDINAPLEPGTPRPIAGIGQILLYDSLSRSNRQEMQLSLRASLTGGTRVYANYSLASMRSDADAASELPANSYDLSSEYGAARADERHRLFLSGNITLPGMWSLSPSFTSASGRPFNIVTGLDNNGDGHLTDRPAIADAAADLDAIQTPWGLLDPTPEAGDPIIARNLGRATAQNRFDMMIMKTFMFGTAPARVLSASVNVENLFNTVNLRDFNGVLVSPVFGQANTAQPARRLSLGIVLSF